ncbi:MAG: hypothetical protein DRI01_06560, partial [Chloroflexi bacterium]
GGVANGHGSPTLSGWLLAAVWLWLVRR